MLDHHIADRAYRKRQFLLAEVVGYLKGKSAIAVARQFGGRERNFNGERLWARGYAVSTVGFEEAQVRAYVRQQEQLDGQAGCEERGSF
jgi:putative transposase